MRSLLFLAFAAPLCLACTHPDPARSLTAAGKVCTPAGGPVVSVVGEVARPGRYPLERDTTLRGAIIGAGGLTRSAYPSAVKVARCGRLVTIDLDAITAGRASDPGLVPGDLVEVQRSAPSALASQRSAPSALASGGPED